MLFEKKLHKLLSTLIRLEGWFCHENRVFSSISIQPIPTYPISVLELLIMHLEIQADSSILRQCWHSLAASSIH